MKFIEFSCWPWIGIHEWESKHPKWQRINVKGMGSFIHRILGWWSWMGIHMGTQEILVKKVRIYIAHEFSVFRNNFSVLRNIFLMRKTWKNLKTFCPTGKPAESCRLRFKHRRGITCQGIAVWQKGKMALGRARGMLLAWGIGTFFCDTRTHHFCKAELRHHTKDIWHLEVRIYFFLHMASGL